MFSQCNYVVSLKPQYVSLRRNRTELCALDLLVHNTSRTQKPIILRKAKATANASFLGVKVTGGGRGDLGTDKMKCDEEKQIKRRFAA
jgi:hypothetical protein